MVGCFYASIMEVVVVHINIQLFQTSFPAEVGLHEFSLWLLMMLGLSRTLFGVSRALFRPRKRAQNRLKQQPCALDGSSHRHNAAFTVALLSHIPQNINWS